MFRVQPSGCQTAREARRLHAKAWTLNFIANVNKLNLQSNKFDGSEMRIKRLNRFFRQKFDGFQKLCYHWPTFIRFVIKN